MARRIRFWSPIARSSRILCPIPSSRGSIGLEVQIQTICDAYGSFGGHLESEWRHLDWGDLRGSEVLGVGVERCRTLKQIRPEGLSILYCPMDGTTLAHAKGSVAAFRVDQWSRRRRTFLPDSSNAEFVEPPPGSQVGRVMLHPQQHADGVAV